MYSVHAEGLLTVAVQVAVGFWFSFTTPLNGDRDREVKVGAGGRGAVTVKDVDAMCVSDPLIPVTVRV